MNFFFYVKIQGSSHFTKDGGFLNLIPDNLESFALFLGIVIGGMLGFFTGLIVGILNMQDSFKGAFVGFVVAEVLIVFVMLFISGESLLSVFLQNSNDFIQYSLIWFLPAILTGLITTKITDISNMMFKN